MGALGRPIWELPGYILGMDIAYVCLRTPRTHVTGRRAAPACEPAYRSELADSFCKAKVDFYVTHSRIAVVWICCGFCICTSPVGQGQPANRLLRLRQNVCDFRWSRRRRPRHPRIQSMADRLGDPLLLRSCSSSTPKRNKTAGYVKIINYNTNKRKRSENASLNKREANRKRTANTTKHPWERVSVGRALSIHEHVSATYTENSIKA